MASPKRKPVDPSMRCPMVDGGITITAAGPVAMLRAWTDGRPPIVLRATLAQLSELIDALIARRSAMAKDRERLSPIPARAAVGLARPEPTIEEEDEFEPPAVVLPPPRVTARPATPPPVVAPVLDRKPDDIIASAPDVVRRHWTRPSREALAAAPEKIRELHAKGWSDGGIAKAIGVSGGHVRTQRIAMGLAPNFQSANPKLRRTA